LGFPSIPTFGAFPPFGLPTPNFSSLNSFPSTTSTTTATTTNFPVPSLLSKDATAPASAADLWPNGLSSSNTNVDYNEYIKQLGLFMNAFNEKPKQTEKDKTKCKLKFFVLFGFISKIYFLASSVIKSSKSKSTTSTNHSHSSDKSNGKTSSSSKHTDDSSHPRPTSTSSSSTSSRRSASNRQSKSSATTTDSTPLDPLAFANAATGGLAYSYFLPSLLSQSTGANTNSSSSTYPFSSLSSSLLNPSAALYPFFSPDWLAASSSSKFLEGFPNLSTGKLRIPNQF